MPENNQDYAGIEKHLGAKSRSSKEPLTASDKVLFGTISILALLSPLYILFIWSNFYDSKIEFQITKKTWEKNEQNLKALYEDRLKETNQLKEEIRQSKTDLDMANKGLTESRTALNFVNEEVAKLRLEVRTLRSEKTETESVILMNDNRISKQEKKFSEDRSKLNKSEADISRLEKQRSNLESDVSILKDEKALYDKDQLESDARLRDLRQRQRDSSEELVNTTTQLIEKESKLRDANQVISDSQKAKVQKKFIESELLTLQGKMEPLDRRLPVLIQQVEQLSKERTELDSQIRQLRKDKNTEQAQKEKIQDQVNVLQASFEALVVSERMTENQLAKTSIEYDELNKTMVGLKEQKIVLEEVVSSLSGNQAKLSTEVSTLKKNKSELEASIKSNQADLEPLIISERMTTNQLAKMSIELDELKKTMIGLKRQKISLEGDVSSLSENQAKLNAEVPNLKKIKSDLEESIKSSQSELVGSEEKNIAASAVLQASIDKQNSLEKSNAALLASIESQQDKIDQLKQKERELNASNERIESRNTSLEARNKTIEEKLTDDLSDAITKFAKSISDAVNRIEADSEDASSIGGQ
ncbi:hypothetical protein N9P88_00345 [Planctomycetota bacterium]|nr:hypothetical protein [Planctomycetota bacterium]